MLKLSDDIFLKVTTQVSAPLWRLLGSVVRKHLRQSHFRCGRGSGSRGSGRNCKRGPGAVWSPSFFLQEGEARECSLSPRKFVGVDPGLLLACLGVGLAGAVRSRGGERRTHLCVRSARGVGGGRGSWFQVRGSVGAGVPLGSYACRLVVI